MDCVEPAYTKNTQSLVRATSQIEDATQTNPPTSVPKPNALKLLSDLAARRTNGERSSHAQLEPSITIHWTTYKPSSETGRGLPIHLPL